jgi:hypothetical protein
MWKKFKITAPYWTCPYYGVSLSTFYQNLLFIWAVKVKCLIGSRYAVYLWRTVTSSLNKISGHVVPPFPWGGTTWMGDLKCREVKAGFWNANRFFWDSHWLKIWKNHSCPSMGPNDGRVAIDSAETRHFSKCSRATTDMATRFHTWFLLPTHFQDSIFLL